MYHFQPDAVATLVFLAVGITAAAWSIAYRVCDEDGRL